MDAHAEWRRAYAGQARADLHTRDLLCRPRAAGIPDCHRLQFLQMACEKLVKAHMYEAGEVAPTVHTIVAKHLPLIVNEYYRRQSGRNLPRHLAGPLKSLAREIELLAPAVRAAGRRQDNCEYPWSAAGRVWVPAEWNFNNLSLHDEVAGRLLLKILPIAIEALV